MRTFQEYIDAMCENDEVQAARRERDRQRLEKLKDAASRGNAEAIKVLQAREELKKMAREELKKMASTDFEAQWRSQNKNDS